MSVKLYDATQASYAKLNDTIVVRGKLGCANSTVNGTYGHEARIYDAYIVENKTAKILSGSYMINDRPWAIPDIDYDAISLDFSSLGLGDLTQIKNGISGRVGSLYYKRGTTFIKVYDNTQNTNLTGWGKGDSIARAEDRLITLPRQRVDPRLVTWLEENALPAVRIGINDTFTRDDTTSTLTLIGRVRVGTSYASSDLQYFTLTFNSALSDFTIDRLTYEAVSYSGAWKVRMTAGDLGSFDLPIIKSVQPTYFSSSQVYLAGAERVSQGTPNPWTLVVRRSIWNEGDYGIVRYTNIYGNVTLKQIPVGTEDILIEDVMPNSEIGLSAEYITYFGQANAISGLTYTGWDDIYGVYTMDINGAVAHFYNAS